MRDHFVCEGCGSIPRERALMETIKLFYPSYPSLTIHESSPVKRGASTRLKRDCRRYSSSQFLPAVEPGKVDRRTRTRCENLEALTLPSESVDIFITQDVMEHILRPDLAFAEIARVLRPGGAHIFTVPLINKAEKSEVWASVDDSGSIVHHHEPEFHGNPVDPNGSLVAMHWGWDIQQRIWETSGLPTTLIHHDDLTKGLRAEFLEVLVSRKPG